MAAYDYIIVGAGSAGAVLATRLSEDPALRVLLVEAGGKTDHWSIRMPAALAANFEGGPWNWCYHSVPQRNLAGRRIYQPRGKGLGGSSAINGMAYIRGHARDYERWSAEGAPGWSYAEVLPYFRRGERHSRGEDAWRGGSGPVATVCYGIVDPINRAFVEGRCRGGIPRDGGRQRLPAGRLRPLRHEYRPGRARKHRARLPPPGEGESELERAYRQHGHQDPPGTAAGRVASSSPLTAPPKPFARNER